MTIITKPISEKKAEKLSVPLVENDQLASVVSVVCSFCNNGWEYSIYDSYELCGGMRYVKRKLKLRQKKGCWVRSTLIWKEMFDNICGKLQALVIIYI